PRRPGVAARAAAFAGAPGRGHRARGTGALWRVRGLRRRGACGVIRTQGLGFVHPGGPRLRFDDVDLPAGGVLLLQGPSGSGKSTWLALAAGLLTPDEGRIQIGGQSVGELRGAARDAWRGAHVGVLPQRLHLSADLSVADNLALVYRAV